MSESLGEYTAALMAAALEQNASADITSVELLRLAGVQLEATRAEIAAMTDGTQSPHISRALGEYAAAITLAGEAVEAVLTARYCIIEEYIPGVEAGGPH
jgi:hypothetical protein